MTLYGNVILNDNDNIECREFVEALEMTTNEKWIVAGMKSNEARTSFLTNIKRVIKYFTYPFITFIKRNKINKIVAWQQFYGLNYAFYCRLFNVKKVQLLVIMTFIYKKKNGFIGKIYHQYIKYILTSKYIDKITCTSETERTLYSEIFNISKQMIVFVPWGVNYFEDKYQETDMYEKPFILSSGRSNRDYEFLIKAIEKTNYKLKIVCDTMSHYKSEQVEVLSNVDEKGFFELLKNCKCVVIPLKDATISAGQTVLLYSFQFRKPVIVTESAGLTDDYLYNKVNGIIISKDEEELINSLDQLYNDDAFYDLLSRNGYELYSSKFSTYQLGCNVGDVVNSCI